MAPTFPRVAYWAIVLSCSSGWVPAVTSRPSPASPGWLIWIYSMCHVDPAQRWLPTLFSTYDGHFLGYSGRVLQAYVGETKQWPLHLSGCVGEPIRRHLGSRILAFNHLKAAISMLVMSLSGSRSDFVNKLTNAEKWVQRPALTIRSYRERI